MKRYTTTIIVIRKMMPTILDGYGWTFQPKISHRGVKKWTITHTHIKSHPIVPIYKNNPSTKALNF